MAAMKFLIRFIALLIALGVFGLVHHFAQYVDPMDPFWAVVMLYGLILAFLVFRVCIHYQLALIEGMKKTFQQAPAKPEH